jgi:hypothetical protein
MSFHAAGISHLCGERKAGGAKLPSYQSGRFGRAAENNAITVQGLTELNRALQLTADGVGAEVQSRIMLIGEYVKQAAISNVQHKTGRRGNPTIEEAMGISVILRGASIYTTAVQGGVQNVGGGPHAGWAARGPHVKRASASHYMDKAVMGSVAYVQQQTEAILDWIETTFQGA